MLLLEEKKRARRNRDAVGDAAAAPKKANRRQKISAVKREIRRGTYETPWRIELTVDRLLRRLG
jgi:hypothetical protein